MATILDISVNRAIDINGFTVPGALATFYDSGTTKVRTVYTNPDATIPHSSPVVANGAGVFPPIYDADEGDVKVEVTDANGVMLAGYPIDPCQRITTDVTGASAVSFEPTAEISQTDVQAAIEQVQANIVAPLAEFGLGVTGNASVIADVDATNTASGIYAYDGTTLGTFPSGIDPADGGTVRIWRETAGAALMILSPRPSTKQYVRRLAGGSWAAWGYVLRNNDTADNSVWAAGASTTPYAASPANIRAAVGAQAIGVDQDWIDLTASRAFGTFYTNNANRPWTIFIVGLQLSVWTIRRPNGGAELNTEVIDADGSDTDNVFTFTVPAGYQYRMTGTGVLKNWWELR